MRSDIRRSACLVFLCFATTLLHAQTLRERVTEYRAARQSGRNGEPDDGSAAGITLPPGVRVLHDVAYGGEREQRMDVYLPPHADKAPVILMVHGGGWRRGDKRMATVVQNKLNRWVPEGFIFVSVDYRLLPEATPDVQAQDVAKALATAQAKAAAWGGDPEKFILMGHSAGAHLVALLSAAPALAYDMGAKPWLGTVALDSAALDVARIMESPHLSLYDQPFGTDPAYWKKVSPLHVLTAAARPVLAVCSTRRAASCDQAHAFVDKANNMGLYAEVLEEDMAHGEINERLGLPSAYTDAVESFMSTLDPVVGQRLTH